MTRGGVRLQWILVELLYLTKKELLCDTAATLSGLGEGCPLATLELSIGGGRVKRTKSEYLLHDAQK